MSPNVCTPIDSIQITFCLPVTAQTAGTHPTQKISRRASMEKRVATVFTGVLFAKKPTRQSVARLYPSILFAFFVVSSATRTRPFCNNNSSLERVCLPPTPLFLLLVPPLFLPFPPKYRISPTIPAKGLLRKKVDGIQILGNNCWRYRACWLFLKNVFFSKFWRDKFIDNSTCTRYILLFYQFLWVF